MNERVLTRAAFIGALFLSACSPTTGDEDDTSATDLAAMAQGNGEKALRGTHRAGSFVADSTTLANSLGAMAGSSTECSQAPCDANGCPPEECVTTKETLTVDDLRESRDDLDESIDELMKTLREKVFTQENLESEADGTATYLLGPKFWCAPDSDSASPSTGGGGSSSNVGRPGTPPLDPDCVDEANRLQIRLRLSSPSDGNVDVELLLTAAKHHPATLELYSNHVGLTTDLGAIKSTLDALGEDTGSLTMLAGKLGFELKRNGELDYSFLASVLEDVKVGITNDDGEEALVGVGKSVPTFELRLDGNAREVTGTLDVGAVTVSGPLNAFSELFDPEEYDDFGEPLPRPHYTGMVQALLAGLEAGITLDGSTDKLTLTHLGVGEQSSTLKVDANTLLQFDLNAANGRHFDLALEKAGAETRATFVPTFDAQAVLKFAPLASQISDLSPSLLDNTLRLWFDGQSPSVETRDDALRIVSGTLNYTDAHAPTTNLTAAPGTCVADGDASGAESVLGLAVTTCQ